MWRPSGTRAIPARAIASGARPRSERPLWRTSPRAIGTRPMIACSVELLPAPFGPIRPTISPLPTSKLRPRTAGTAPYRTSSPSIASAASGTDRLPQVGSRDVEVPADLLGRPRGERPPPIQHLHAAPHLPDQ